MSLWQMLAVFAAGIWGGMINTVVGSGTLVTFPVLLGVGLSPISANVSNTLGLFPGSFVGAYGYRRELSGQGRRVAMLGPAAVVGAAGGSLLVLALPPGAFKAIVPVLIALALVLVIFGRRFNTWLAARGRHATTHVTPALAGTIAVTGVYGGYFGAAQGVLMMGLFGVFLADDIQRQNGLKNVLSGLINLAAAVVFVVIGDHIDWSAAGLIAAGSIVGGLIGARIGRRLSPVALRTIIVLIGIAAIVKLLV